MSSQKNGPATDGAVDTGMGTSKQGNISATPRKWQRVLQAFIDGGSYNRFEAVRELGDWCLNSTVSELEQRGISISRRDEVVPGAFGEVRCCRYWLAANSIEAAKALLTTGQPSQRAARANV